ncbi:MAG TPA: amino acid ABC transporter substrate-binding protein [Candidatus Acidoferrales bacterium]|nr:amino acid ABC transporter substrate-binding protein [Candidatus Acidoferrales bacterium]
MRASCPNYLHGLTRAAMLVALATLPLVCLGPARAQDDIGIGVVMPITGREAKPGQYQREGIELAIKQINDGGGIFIKSLKKKLPIREVFYDDGSDSARSASLVERAMSTDNVVGVVGGYSTALGEPESVMPDRYKTPWITPGAAASSIFSKGYQYIFGTLSSVENLGYTTGQFLGWLVDQGKLKKGLKIALVVENTDHGKDYVNGTKKWMDEYPGYFTVVFDEKFALGGTDFSGLLQKVKAAHADIFLSDAHLQDYVTMQRQYLQAGMYHQIISYGARGPEADARKALGAGADYVVAGIWWSSDLKYPQVQKFNADYQAFTGHAPDSWYAATAYEAMRMMAQSIEKAGSLNKDAIRDQLRSGELKNSLLPGSSLKFGANGQATNAFVIVQNKPDGKVDIVFPSNSATGLPIAPKPQN